MPIQIILRIICITPEEMAKAHDVNCSCLSAWDNPNYEPQSRQVRYPCKDNVLLESDIIDIVLATIRQFAYCAVKLEKLVAAQQHCEQLDKKVIFKTLQSLQMKRKQMKGQLSILYEALIDGSIGRDECIRKKQALSEQVDKCGAVTKPIALS